MPECGTTQLLYFTQTMGDLTKTGLAPIFLSEGNINYYKHF